jgi:hypothetical protein
MQTTQSSKPLHLIMKNLPNQMKTNPSLYLQSNQTAKKKLRRDSVRESEEQEEFEASQG